VERENSMPGWIGLGFLLSLRVKKEKEVVIECDWMGKYLVFLRFTKICEGINI
jgi:hypothetical protein